MSPTKAVLCQLHIHELCAESDSELRLTVLLPHTTPLGPGPPLHHDVDQFEGSCWSAVAHLAVIEKGFTPEQINIKSVSLVEGQNFSPEYLKVSPKGTVPALVVRESIS